MNTLVRLCCLLLSSALIAAAHPTGHPRLFFDATDTSAINARIASGGDPRLLFDEVLESASWYVDRHQYMWDVGGSHGKFAFYENLPGIAFAYLVTHEQRFADRAKELVFRVDPQHPVQQGIILDQIPGQWNPDPAAAILSRRVIALSLVYDFLYDQLTDTQRTQIQNRIIADLDFHDVPTRIIVPDGIIRVPMSRSRTTGVRPRAGR